MRWIIYTDHYSTYKLDLSSRLDRARAKIDQASSRARASIFHENRARVELEPTSLSDRVEPSLKSFWLGIGLARIGLGSSSDRVNPCSLGTLHRRGTLEGCKLSPVCGFISESPGRHLLDTTKLTFDSSARNSEIKHCISSSISEIFFHKKEI